MSRLQRSGPFASANLGLRPRLIWNGPSALKAEHSFEMKNALEEELEAELDLAAGAGG